MYITKRIKSFPQEPVVWFAKKNIRTMKYTLQARSYAFDNSPAMHQNNYKLYRYLMSIQTTELVFGLLWMNKFTIKSICWINLPSKVSAFMTSSQQIMMIPKDIIFSAPTSSGFGDFSVSHPPFFPVIAMKWGIVCPKLD